jgi:hypothetical protein
MPIVLADATLALKDNGQAIHAWPDFRRVKNQGYAAVPVTEATDQLGSVVELLLRMASVRVSAVREKRECEAKNRL